MSLYHMYVAAFGPPEAVIFRGTHFLFAITLVYVLYPLMPGRRAAWRIVDLVLLAAAWAMVLHIFFNYSYFNNRIIYIDELTAWDKFYAVVSILVVLEGTRRVIGWALPITALVFLAYAVFFTQVRTPVLLEQLYFSTEGIWGSTLGVSASYVMLFVLFGAFMEKSGTGQLFMDFAMGITGHTAGGPGKVSVVSSSLFGTISGSAVANVMVDGPISIPLMKRTGFRAHFAAAVEAVASTGGQIMPPIMGAAAFVMAEFQGVSYLQIVVWATIPAILYYVSCFAAVHFEAKRQGLLGVPRSQLPVLREVLVARGHLFIPVSSILFVMYSGYSAPLAAFTGTILCFPVAWFGPVVLLALPALMVVSFVIPSVPTIIPEIFGLNPLIEAALVTGLILLWMRAVRGKVILLKIEFQPIVDALIDGARNTIPVALACAAAGIIIGIVILTGLGITFTQ